MIILNLVFTFAVPGISIGGHIGGLIAGFVLMLSFVRFRHSWQASVITTALILVASVIVAYSAVS